MFILQWSFFGPALLHRGCVIEVRTAEGYHLISHQEIEFPPSAKCMTSLFFSVEVSSLRKQPPLNAARCEAAVFAG